MHGLKVQLNRTIIFDTTNARKKSSCVEHAVCEQLFCVIIVKNCSCDFALKPIEAPEDGTKPHFNHLRAKV